MKHLSGFLPVAVLFIMLLAGMAAGILQKDKTYSSVENRTLQQFPKLNAKRVFNGKFQKKYEKYLADQFPARDSWVKLQSITERAFGKTESNGVYFGKNGYLLEKYTEEDIDKKLAGKNINVLAKFAREASKTADVKVMIVPSKTFVLKDYLPAFAETYDEIIFYNKLEKKLPDNVIIDVYNTLKEHMDEDIFYRTDHHWTTYGAWYAYHAYINGTGLADAETKKDLKTVSKSFLGSSYSKVNMYSKKDNIDIYEPVNEMTVVYNLGEKTENTFYQTEFLKKKDKYSVFFGGNQALLEISGGTKNKKTLFIVKDSFANCIIPFLAEDYEKVVVADMRHLNAGMTMLLRKYNPTDVLVLYNTIQFMQDKDFALKL
ncbi:MAG: DHHW family protein [Lachnospiraceae bacterium]|nr:DHHW family protein [Lachnospiraceae bacterium]